MKRSRAGGEVRGSAGSQMGDFFETPEEGFQELWKCFEYFNSIWEERKANGSDGNDLISMLARGENTKNMTPNEFLGNVIPQFIHNKWYNDSMTSGKNSYFQNTRFYH